MATPEDEALFRSYGLEGALKQVASNAALGAALKRTLSASGVAPGGTDKAIANQLFSVAGGLPDARAVHRDALAALVGAGKLRSSAQITAALNWVKRFAPDSTLDIRELERACGVGLVFTSAQARERADGLLANAGSALLSDRYTFPLHTLLAAMKEGEWKWADGKCVKDAFDAAVLSALGPRTAEDELRVAEAKKSKGTATAPCTLPTSSPGVGVDSHASAVNSDSFFAARELEAARNSPALLEEHTHATHGIIRTRFPPEPNGFLHIGHAKSMHLNFEGAFRALGLKEGGGETIFRYDDTNPDAESEEYIRNQAENVEWMGWHPVRVTHSSNYFHELYALAQRLILSGDAYVCHQSKEEVEASREIARSRDGRCPDSPWRNRPSSESLSVFADMRAGRFDEGAATLRLRIDMTSANPTLWDPVAYRIKYTRHPHTGDAWCIYPSYDFSHAIIDSLEHIDYSLCTLEFEVRRDLYYWVLARLDMWRPHVWEFARLNITHVQLSKRKILALVAAGRVRGWDDPRIPTINGLRRRGYTAAAINSFCHDIGVSRHDNTVEHAKLEHHIRLHLDDIAVRHFVVLRPLRVELTNVPADKVWRFDAPDFPRDASLGSHLLTISRVVYIEADDFREVDDPSYFGLALGKVVGLRYAGYVRATGVVRDPLSGAVVGLTAEYDHDRSASFAGGVRVKGNMHWVSGETAGVEPPRVEVRLYDHLFTTDVPGSSEGGWEGELNPASEVVISSALADPFLLSPGRAIPGRHFQFERVGYFVCDADSGSGAVGGKLVFNRVCELKARTEVLDVRAAGGRKGAA